MFLNDFKSELLNYLKRQYDLLQTCPPVEKVYNVLTLEVIKILHMLLQFGLFTAKINEKKEEKKQFSMMNIIGSETKIQSNKSDIDRLVEYLALILEYD